MRCEHLLAALVALVALVGCQTGATCIRHSDCASGLVCGSDNLCAAPPDAAWPDAGLDAAEDGGGDAARDARTDAGADARSDAGLDARADARGDAQPDAAIVTDPRDNVGTGDGSQLGPEPRPDASVPHRDYSLPEAAP
ncbi:MAG: hypothetical protein K8W52_08675 [Deltaproteobacteria bacterium]|nr:hypothetical protein [Deltaproteobacteria bacterium]